MCQSKAEGGLRCAAHIKPRLEAATPGTNEWRKAAGEYAATPSGRADLEQRAEAAAADGDSETFFDIQRALRDGNVLTAVAEQVKAKHTWRDHGDQAGTLVTHPNPRVSPGYHFDHDALRSTIASAVGQHTDQAQPDVTFVLDRTDEGRWQIRDGAVRANRTVFGDPITVPLPDDVRERAEQTFSSQVAPWEDYPAYRVTTRSISGSRNRIFDLVAVTT